jgi:hypothetical protein
MTYDPSSYSNFLVLVIGAIIVVLWPHQYSNMLIFSRFHPISTLLPTSATWAIQWKILSDEYKDLSYFASTLVDHHNRQYYHHSLVLWVQGNVAFSVFCLDDCNSAKIGYLNPIFDFSLENSIKVETAWRLWCYLPSFMLRLSRNYHHFSRNNLPFLVGPSDTLKGASIPFYCSAWFNRVYLSHS